MEENTYIRPVTVQLLGSIAQSPGYEDAIDLRERIRVLWQSKFWIIGSTS